SDPDIPTTFEFTPAGLIVSKQTFHGGPVRNLVGSHIHHDCTGLDEFACDHRGAAHCGDNDIGLTSNLHQVTCFGVTDGDGRIRMHQQHGLRLADVVATSEDHGI